MYEYGFRRAWRRLAMGLGGVSAALALGASGAQAAETLVNFSDQSPSFTSPVANPLNYPGVSFSSANGLRVFSFNGFLDRGLCPHATNACRSALVVEFASPIDSLSFDVLQVDEADSLLSVSVFTSGGTARRSVALSRGFNVNRIELTGLAGATRLTLDGTSDEEGVIYDNFRFNAPGSAGAVPEPAAWALLICGFGAVGGLMRRRRGGRPARGAPRSAVVLAGVATVAALAGPAAAGTFRNPKAPALVDFRGDASEAATLLRLDNGDVLRGVTSVVIPQFTVEFVEASDGLGTARSQKISVTYRLAGLSDAERQTVTDQVYERFADALQRRGIQVRGPKAALGVEPWAKLAATARTEPMSLKRSSLETRIFSAQGAPYLPPSGAQAASGAAGAAAQTASQGLAVGGMFSSRLAGAAGAAQGAMALGRLGSGLSSFNGALGYAKAEPEIAAAAQAAVMTVHLIVGLRETDKPSQLFASIRSASSLVGEPRLAILSEGTTVSVYAPNAKVQRAQFTVAKDLLFREDVLQGRTALKDGAAGAASNIAARGMFLAGVVAGGGIDLYQSHNVECTPDPAAFGSAVQRNLGAVADMVVARLP